MSIAVLTRLAEQGEPLWYIFHRYLRPDYQGPFEERETRFEIVGDIMAGFLVCQFKREIGYRDVTRNSVKYITKKWLMELFPDWLDDDSLDFIAEIVDDRCSILLGGDTPQLLSDSEGSDT